ncbi:MAG: hypothetical protein CMO55_12400 [Verrucomicrobiales bacterium]|nr:hypothetical protein [Verrucomicrobiales bacterium]
MSDTPLRLPALSAVFCATHAEHFQDVFETRADNLLESLRAGGGSSAKFMVFGRYDHLILTLSDDPEDLRMADRELNLTSQVANQWATYGRVLSMPEDYEGLEELAKDFPLMGVCFLRVNRSIVSQNPSMGYLDEIIREMKSVAAGHDDTRWIVTSTTGWEDVMLLVFGKAFTSIADVVRNVRQIPNPNNSPDASSTAMLTSCTLPAIHFSWRRSMATSREEREELAGTLLQSVREEDPMAWNVRFEVAPGRGDFFMKKVEEMAKESLLLESKDSRIHYSLVFGQVDVSLTQRHLGSSENQNLTDLIRFLIHVGFAISGQMGTPVRAMQTVLYLDQPLDLQHDEEINGEGMQNFLRPVGTLRDSFESEARSTLQELGMPIPTINVIEGMMARLDSLHEDEFLSDEFLSLYMLGRGFIKKTTVSLETVLKRGLFDSDRLQELRSALGEWKHYLARCLSDRYRGRYPTGENTVLPLSSHQNSYHKFLTVADVLVSQIYFLARHHTNRRVQEVKPDEAVNHSMALIPIGVFVGDSPSPYAITEPVKSFYTAFIDVSSDLVFDLKQIIYLAHEVGHVLFKEFDKHCIDPEQYPYWGQHKTFVSEILCEAFGCAICTEGDMTVYAQLSDRVIRHYYPDEGVYQKGTLLKAEMIRFAANGVLDAVAPKSLEKADRRIRLSGLRRDFEAHWEPIINSLTGGTASLVNRDYQAIYQALSSISNHYQYQDEFFAFLESIGDCRHADVFQHFDEQARLLPMLRKFLKSNATSDSLKASENFSVLDDMWSRAAVTLRELKADQRDHQRR